jgi:simple sugar transport system permease protein
MIWTRLIEGSAEFARKNRYRLGFVLAVLVVVVGALEISGIETGRVFTAGFFERTVRAAVPITLAAIGGLYAEKSGVFNIGLEGFMIFGAVNAVAISFLVAGGENATVAQTDIWIGLTGALLISIVMSTIFAILLIRYDADQIVAGLAVWFIGLGFGPFTAVIIWGSQSSPPVGRIGRINVPALSEIPYVGTIFFNTSPLVWLTFLLVALSWYVLYYTRYGYWVQAAGENPEALDTAGVDVNRVRYATTIFSGAIAGFGGAVLAVGITTSFVGGGLTMVDGRGWIAIVAYLFGNYNPVGAFLAAILFGGANMFQVQLQTVGIDLSSTLTGLLPYVIVLVVLTLYGTTQMPSEVGESYESES